MRVEIISTGTELLLGEIVNTSVVFLSERFNELGYSVLYQTVVGDNEGRLKEVYEIALNRSDIIVTTGGLGPTEGDITKHVMAKVLNRKLENRKDCQSHIEAIFARRSQKMPQNNLRQAMIPEGAEALENRYGTAPGVWLETGNGKIVIQLPGPPFEMKHMFESQVVMRLEKQFGRLGQIASVSLHAIGIGESLLAEELHDLITRQLNPTIALLSSKNNSGIRIRLTAKAENKNKALELILPLKNEIKNQLVDYIWGTDEETLPEKVSNLLQKRAETIATAESCTGGYLGYELTKMRGSSSFYLGGVVCYTNESKIRDCGVSEKTLNQFGAVSAETAGELARGIAQRFGSDFGISITGLAGPDGGTEEKKIGLVYIGLWHKSWSSAEVKEYQFIGKRDEIRKRSVQNALFYILSRVENNIMI